MDRIPACFVGCSRDLLLTEIDAALESAFVDFQQCASDTVKKLIVAASNEQIQTDFKIHQGGAIKESPSLHAATVQRLLDWPPPATKSTVAGTALSLLPDQEPNASVAEEWQDTEQCELLSIGRDRVESDSTCDQISQESFLKQISPAKASEQQSNNPRHQTVDTFGRRMSSASNEDFADLRVSLHTEWLTDHRISVRSTRCSRYVKLAKACLSCNLLGAEFIEPKDLHFDQLASRKGRLWKELSLSEQVEMIREELTRTSFIIDPQSDMVKIWDILIMFCLVFTAAVLPYEVAFLETEYGPMYVLNHTINMIFVIDMMLQFFLKVRIEVRHKTRWVRKRGQIAANYLKSWFAVDLLSIIPYDDISNLASTGEGSGLEHLKIMRLLRVLRFMKLFRILKASRLVKRWENRNSLQSSSKHLIKCCILIMVSVHWMACIWGFVGIWEGSNLKCRRTLQDDDQLVLRSPTASWYVDLDQQKLPNDSAAWKGQSWVVAFALDRASYKPIDPCKPFSLYIVSIYWAIMTMTSIGYGDILPQVPSEYVVSCLCMIVSGIVWAYIIGIASAVLSTMYPESTQFEQRLDAFNSMVCDMNVPTRIRLRGREFLRESRYKWSHERNSAVIQSLGFDLQTNLSKQSGQRYLGNIILFSRCSGLFRADCAVVMDPHLFEPHYVVQLFNHLCVVDKGAVGHNGRVLVPWNHWGEDFIVAKMQLRFQAPAVAMNYTVVVSLSSTKVESVLASHPYERLLFARAAIGMALRGAARIYLSELDNQKILPENRWIHELIDGPTSSK